MGESAEHASRVTEAVSCDLNDEAVDRVRFVPDQRSSGTGEDASISTGLRETASGQDCCRRQVEIQCCRRLSPLAMSKGWGCV